MKTIFDRYCSLYSYVYTHSQIHVHAYNTRTHMFTHIHTYTTRTWYRLIRTYYIHTYYMHTITNNTAHTQAHT